MKATSIWPVRALVRYRGVMICIVFLALLVSGAHSRAQYNTDAFTLANQLVDEGNRQRARGDFTTIIQHRDKLDGEKGLFSAGAATADIITASYNNRGIAWEAMGDFAKAAADFNEAIVTNPRAAGAFANRGRVRQEQGELAAALEDLNKALDLDPQAAKAYMDRGLVRLIQGNKGDADKDFQKCIALNPNLKPLLDSKVKLLSETRVAASSRK